MASLPFPGFYLTSNLDEINKANDGASLQGFGCLVRQTGAKLDRKNFPFKWKLCT